MVGASRCGGPTGTVAAVSFGKAGRGFTDEMDVTTGTEFRAGRDIRAGRATWIQCRLTDSVAATGERNPLSA